MRQFAIFLITLTVITSCDTKKELELPYILKIPNRIKDSTLYPLVICLHGAGGRGKDNSGRGSEAYKVLDSLTNIGKYNSFLFVPQCPKKEQWVDTPWQNGNYSIENIKFSDELQWVNKMIDSLIMKYPIDHQRIYITGQSMGGFATWDILVRYPDKFACAIPICGGGDTSKVANIARIPTWIFHGENDNVVAVESSRQMYYKLQNISNSVYYTEFENVGHNSWTLAWQMDTLVKWMFRQKKE